jgi:hypothetical protein
VFVVELEKMKKSGTSSVPGEVRVSEASEDLAPLPSLPSVEPVLSSSPVHSALDSPSEDKAKSRLMERISKLGVPTMTAKPVTPVSSSPPRSSAVAEQPPHVEPIASAVPVTQPYVAPAQPLLAATQPQPMYHAPQLGMPQSTQLVLSSQYSAQPQMYQQQMNQQQMNAMSPYMSQPNMMMAPQPATGPLSTSEMVQLLVDERQYKVELKQKVDTMSTKLEQVRLAAVNGAPGP